MSTPSLPGPAGPQDFGKISGSEDGSKDSGMDMRANPPPRQRLKRGEAIGLAMIPWMVFTFIACLFSVSEDIEVLGWGFAGICALMSVLFCTVGYLGGNVVPLALGLFCLTAITVSVPVGLIVKETYMKPYWHIEDGALYRNVDPLEVGATMSDGTLFEFIEGTFVDTERSVGYMKSGDVFCVAPISGPTKSESPSIWAVGKGCCSQKSHFTCGDAGDDKAHSALGVGDDGKSEKYLKAVRMAQATFDMKPLRSPPLFVVWTDDAVGEKNSLFWNGAALVSAASLVHLISSLLSALFLGRNLPARRKD
eukprot:TRINITY_DN17386_c0_g1_i1.p1 TRINITY_DN17386_c0_g1~~TRINITY_DN17386_c0_g1_i1.p1  ORF type:complete len:308 (-),score=50.84 TRINITY_DN17386_c0_g1_i1:145-1068(-)